MRQESLTGDSAIQFLQSKLNRPLTQYERDIANHPRVCMISNTYGNPPDELKDCKQCFCVTFAPEYVAVGQCKHEKWCKPLRIVMEDYKNEQTIGHQVRNFVKFCKIFS